MSLTPQQLQAIKAAIVADSTLNAQPQNSDGAAAIAEALNATAAPDFIVWRTDIPAREVVSAIVGTEFAGLVAIKQALLMLLITPGTVNAASPNVQADFAAIFSPGASLTSLAALAKRKATVFEKLLATGTGSTASPATMGAESPVSDTDIALARKS